jgi:hypothetical protein
VLFARFMRMNGARAGYRKPNTTQKFESFSRNAVTFWQLLQSAAAAGAAVELQLRASITVSHAGHYRFCREELCEDAGGFRTLSAPNPLCLALSVSDGAP